jgi:hypothetical protein
MPRIPYQTYSATLVPWDDTPTQGGETRILKLGHTHPHLRIGLNLKGLKNE